MHKKFDHQDIERKWQLAWEHDHLYDVKERDHTKEKEYVLIEWPYPSGNLHIGHWFAFAVVDIYVRMRRMQGRQVLFPIGFDAFGLPAENAAIKHKLDPKGWTESNVAHMKEQLRSMGNAFSWNVSTSSTDPSYYAWTQWMFGEFFKQGIAYRGRGIVNWCPGCNTVIANEQVTPRGACERSGDLIEKREMPQWMLRITRYADRLIDDLNSLDWPEHIKEAQRQWIGRSEGALLPFRLSSGQDITVFTTRPDTLFGATYLVLAHDHDILQSIRGAVTNWSDVEAYAKDAVRSIDTDRTNALREKTGVMLHGVSARNPATGEDIPIFVADYVLKSYGTGAIMAVPAHDERDFRFAEEFDLPVKEVIKGGQALPYTGNGTLVNSGEFDGADSEAVKIAITERFEGKLSTTFRLRDWSIGRQRYWGVPVPIVYDLEGVAHPIPKEHLPWLLPTDVDFTPTGEPPLAKSKELLERTERIFGAGWRPEVETMDTFVDSSWYFLRYLDPNNSESLSALERQKEWMPIDVYFGGAEHTTMHLLYSRFWQKALFDLGLVTESEPYRKRVNRGLVLGPDGNKMSKSKGNVIDPDEEVRRLGADTVKMYLAFMGPYGEPTNYPWSMDGIAGQRRFLERVHGLRDHVKDTKDMRETKLLHKTIAKVTDDISAYKFNTAISALMVYVNLVEKSGLALSSYKAFLKLLAPFAPHLSEELWHQSGESASIHESTWPVADESIARDERVTIAIQVNGKMRGTVTVACDADEATVRACAETDPLIGRKIGGVPSRVIFVKNRILNLIIEGEGK